MRNAILGSFIGVLLATGVLVACGSSGSGSTDVTVEELAVRVAELEALLGSVSRDTGGNIVLTDEDVIIQGGNLIVQNGLGSTASTNGKGNVILGYNEFRVIDNVRTGSHMLVVGSGLNYSSYGGIVAGHVNGTEGPYACVTGGYRNRASGESSAVTGGWDNHAEGLYASVVGGEDNTASGEGASVSGGLENLAQGETSSIAGGFSNWTVGRESSILGGLDNETWSLGTHACVSGGRANHAKHYASSITGGRENVVADQYGSITGGRANVVVDDTNPLSDGCATISGGYDHSVFAEYDWRAGLLFQDD